MARQASLNKERSNNEVEAYDLGFTEHPKGEEWSYKANREIRGIMIGYKDIFIGSLVFQSIDENGHAEYSDTFGSYDTIDKTEHKIILELPQERFTSLSVKVCHHPVRTEDVIPSISFHIEHPAKHTTFGPSSGSRESSREFRLSLDGREIVGFYGRHARDCVIIQGLGVYVKRRKNSSGSTSRVQVLNPKNEEVSSFEEAECIKVGPWGWSRPLEEEEWSYMLELKGKMEIKIHCNDNHIQAISFKPPNENEVIKHPENSNTGTVRTKHIPLNFPEEYLVSISGTTNSSKGIESLCFYTNKTIHGPFGPMKGNRFRFYMKRGIIVGFHGRGANLFDALGVYIKPFSELFKNENTEKDRRGQKRSLQSEDLQRKE